MKKILSTGAIILLAVGLASSAKATWQATAGVDWPIFRGPRASGIAEGFATATTWDAESGQGVLWKTPIPGLAHSSPIVWGDRVFVPTAISSADNSLRVGLYGDITPVEDDSVHTWKVYALDKRSGEIVWERTAHTGVPRVKRHTKATHASATMATDGAHVIAYFGSEGLYAYTTAGELLWKKDFGVLDAGYYVVPEAQWNVGSSPIIYDGKVILQADVQRDSFIAAFELADGSEVWRTARNDVPTWGTPNVYESDGGSQIVVNGYRHIGAYDADTGAEIWRMEGGGDIPVPTPVFAHELIFITNAHGRGAPIYAIRPSASGDISLAEGESSNRGIAWSTPREGAYMVTPLVYGDYLYNLKNNGALAVYDARSGEQMYQARLGRGGGFTASPVAADGKVYFSSEDGDIFVVAAGPEFELLATNPMGEVCMATPAISEGLLLFRTVGHVVAIAAPNSRPPGR
jgi:outer membrane protein assembly factor BamB